MNSHRHLDTSSKRGFGIVGPFTRKMLGNSPGRMCVERHPDVVVFTPV